jgi:sulfite reductase (NADPH) flavoprotein alpha-component
MAAMGQLDCGQCGYDCRRYAEAIAARAEPRLTLCAPGGKPTQRALKQLLASAGSAPPQAPAVSPAATGAAAPTLGTREHPAIAHLRVSTRLTAPASDKDTRFVAIDLNGSGITYEVGDSLGIFPENCPDLVDAVMRTLKAAPDERIRLLEGGDQPLRDTLLRERELKTPSEELYALMVDYAQDPIEQMMLTALLRGEEGLPEAEGWDVLDVLKRFPSARPPASAVAVALEPLRPRLYSISSSQRANPQEVHLTVAVVRFQTGERVRKGMASTFLAERAHERELRVFVQPSHGFRLPISDSTPIIMIGPGTGVAPFRAFLAERKARGSTGRNWLFFGERHEQTDFLYREELEASLREGTLTRLDTAFSRDQAERIYVQHRMAEQGAELWAWIRQGAHVYVCGDAKQMAGDVHRMLHEILARHGGMSDAQAKEYVARMSSDRRYQRDVY